MDGQAAVGVIGGSGPYSFLEPIERVEVATPYGPPSDRITVAEVAGRRVLFLPRHGASHTIPPHQVNYRANLWALRELGATRVIGPCAVGSLKAEHAPGTAVICDQLIDRTQGRQSTYWDGPEVQHLSFADPYCSELRPLAVAAMAEAEFPTVAQGTIVVVQGPRFSTRAESRWYSSIGGDVVGMSAFPEAALAHELGLCFVNISLITDYDSGLDGDRSVDPGTHAQMTEVFARNADRLSTGLISLLGAIPRERTCACGTVTTPHQS